MMDDTDDPSGLSQYIIWETKSYVHAIFLADSRRYLITASAGNTHRVLKIDRTDVDLSVVEDSTDYDNEQLDLLLKMVDEGNKSQGGLTKVMDFFGIVGFVKFTSAWYLCIVTQRSVVGLLGGHYSELGGNLTQLTPVYHCDKTKVRNATSPCSSSADPSSSRSRLRRPPPRTTLGEAQLR